MSRHRDRTVARSAARGPARPGGPSWPALIALSALAVMLTLAIASLLLNDDSFLSGLRTEHTAIHGRWHWSDVDRDARAAALPGVSQSTVDSHLRLMRIADAYIYEWVDPKLGL